MKMFREKIIKVHLKASQKEIKIKQIKLHKIKKTKTKIKKIIFLSKMKLKKQNKIIKLIIGITKSS